jgi:hypothetical protein
MARSGAREVGGGAVEHAVGLPPCPRILPIGSHQVSVFRFDGQCDEGAEPIVVEPR